MSYVARDFMTAIAEKDAPAYWQWLWWYLGTFAVAVPLGAYYRWTEERLALLWREWMAQHLIKRYFNNRAYYRLRGSASIDNPDQRISEDVRNFTSASLSFLLIALNATVTVVAFVGVLWAISGTLVGTARLRRGRHRAEHPHRPSTDRSELSPVSERGRFSLQPGAGARQR
jgi:putative ATP-binding cassette transporter